MFVDPNAAFKAFGLTLPGQSGSCNTLRADGVFNIDGSLSKVLDMPYSENHKLQFRAEVFNVTMSARCPSTWVRQAPSVNTKTRWGNPRVMQFGAGYYFENSTTQEAGRRAEEFLAREHGNLAQSTSQNKEKPN